MFEHRGLRSPSSPHDLARAPSVEWLGRRPVQLALHTLEEAGLSAEAVHVELDDKHGEIFTRRWIVELILDLVGYTPDRDLAALAILEPACGSGAFLVPIVERLVESCKRHGRALGEADDSVRAYDLLERNVCAARQAVVDTLVAGGQPLPSAKITARRWVKQADFLLREPAVATVDVVVGNPPYIRLEEIPPARSAAYRRTCPTMGGRADIFVGFFEVGVKALKAEGRLGFICADRWMRNAYGKELRRLISEDYAVDAAIVMHDVDAFEEQVSAYPAVTVLRNGKQGHALVADTTRQFDSHAAGQLSAWALSRDPLPLHTPAVSAAWLSHWFTTSQGWPTGSPDRLALVADLEERFPLLEETGVKVGIGLASGADRVYVTTDANAAEPGRMLPMVMRGDLRSGAVKYSGHFLLNPWDAEGLVNLADWPRLAACYHAHLPALKARNVARRNPGREHRTIDRVIEGLAQTPKLLLADMSERIWPVLDEGQYYPHHNLYWMTSDTWDLRALGGLLLSDAAELFISTYCVRMRGGTLRFQAQYLRRIRLPRFSDIGQDDVDRLRDAFERRDTELATTVALRLYGVEAIPA